MTTTADSTRRGVLVDVGMVRRQVRVEQRSFWRNPAAAGFTFVFPLMFLVIFSSLSGQGSVDLAGGGKIGFATYYLPGIIGFSVLQAGFTGLTMSLVNRRDAGILKRVRGTPLPIWSYVAGILGSQFVVTVVLAVVTSAVSMLAFDVPFPRHVLPLVGVLILGAACFSALGVAMTSVIPNADAAPAIVNVIIFPLLFLSGTFFPITNDTINQISDILPISRLQGALFDSFAPPVEVHGHLTHAGGPQSSDLWVLFAWFAVGAFVAVRRFRWEPRTK